MGAIALFRQIGAGLIIAGNLSFKQGATIAADRGIEEGRAWLKNPAQTEGVLSGSATGYFPAWCYTKTSTADCNTISTDFDPFSFDWSTAVKAVDDDGAGNSVRWVIHRLCQKSGLAASSGCITTPPIEACDDPSDPSPVCPKKSSVFYRITTQVSGPRNTVSYTQAIVY